MSAPAIDGGEGAGEVRDRADLDRSRRLACAGLLAIVVPLGLIWRLAPLHLPQFAFKYGGSALWAVAVYWVIAGLLPRWRVAPLAVFAAGVALGVELFKRVRWAPMDAFRETLPGKLLLGRYFTLGAIAVYWIAIALVAVADTRFSPGRTSGP